MEKIKVKLPNGEVVENCGISQMKLLDRPRNLAFIPVNAEQVSEKENDLKGKKDVLLYLDSFIWR